MTEPESSPPLITVALPAYNEEKAIVHDLCAIHAAMQAAGWTYEVLVVDDGCTDRTAALAVENGARVVRHERNMGNGRARKTALRHARGEIIVMTDADGTYPNDRIPDLVRELERADMVVGARDHEAGTMRVLRTIAKEAIRHLAQIISGSRIPDLNSGLRAFRRATALLFLGILPDTHSWVTTITLAYLCNDYIVRYVSIPYYPRIGKSTFHPIKDTYNYLMNVVRTVVLFRPMKILMPVSLALCAGGLLKFVWDWQIHSDVRESDIMIILVGVIVGAAALLGETVVASQRGRYQASGPGREEVLGP
ncbi:MAG: glycosyltransferase family 2 protein [Candidatus Schekmanbacteria bacterium]|nr:glycosyltransferase family 2 protein [Candidatus Schekmanbacteria bacterium]